MFISNASAFPSTNIILKILWGLFPLYFIHVLISFIHQFHSIDTFVSTNDCVKFQEEKKLIHWPNRIVYALNQMQTVHLHNRELYNPHMNTFSVCFPICIVSNLSAISLMKTENENIFPSARDTNAEELRLYRVDSIHRL